MTIRKLGISFLLVTLIALFGCASTQNRESTGQYLDSAATTTKVKAQLVSALGVRSITGIDVSTYKGVVQLSGFVNKQGDIPKAVKAAQSVKGVKAVENSLLVKSKLG